MERLEQGVIRRPIRWYSVLPLTLLVAFCAGRAPIRTTAENPASVDIGQLWVEPVDLESRDLFFGPGGIELAPDPAMAFDFVAADTSGYSPGYDVSDSSGTKWSVKLGSEAQPEIVTSRLLWALGYHQPPTYLLSNWQLVGQQAGRQGIARFRREIPTHKVVAEWSWYENPFAMTQPFKGLVVANLMLNNWDWKTSNNKVYDEVNADGTGRRVYVVRDLGASLGKTTFPKFLTWTPFRGVGQGSRNDVADFEEQGFIKGLDGERVRFEYRGIHRRLVDTITVSDVVWTCRLMDRLTDAQWHDIFRAAGYQDSDQQRFITKLKSKIKEGLTLQGA